MVSSIEHSSMGHVPRSLIGKRCRGNSYSAIEVDWMGTLSLPSLVSSADE